MRLLCMKLDHVQESDPAEAAKLFAVKRALERGRLRLLSHHPSIQDGDDPCHDPISQRKGLLVIHISREKSRVMVPLPFSSIIQTNAGLTMTALSPVSHPQENLQPGIASIRGAQGS